MLLFGVFIFFLRYLLTSTLSINQNLDNYVDIDIFFIVCQQIMFQKSIPSFKFQYIKILFLVSLDQVQYVFTRTLPYGITGRKSSSYISLAFSFSLSLTSCTALFSELYRSLTRDIRRMTIRPNVRVFHI